MWEGKGGYRRGCGRGKDGMGEDEGGERRVWERMREGKGGYRRGWGRVWERKREERRMGIKREATVREEFRKHVRK
jgi:hypothetical protein